MLLHIRKMNVGIGNIPFIFFKTKRNYHLVIDFNKINDDDLWEIFRLVKGEMQCQYTKKPMDQDLLSK